MIEVPAHWNGTLALYSHGYVPPGFPNPPRDVGDPLTRSFLLANGFALTGSAYLHTGWAVQEAFHDQIAVLDLFERLFGKPQRTVAWGHSLGGLITAGLLQLEPDRFTTALPMCGVLGGGVSAWNVALDAAFVFWQLATNGDPSLQLVHISHPSAATHPGTPASITGTSWRAPSTTVR